MCELIGRVDADPDVLPRTENFGLDYIAFSAMCPKCPPDFLKLTYNCVKVCISWVDRQWGFRKVKILRELLSTLEDYYFPRTSLSVRAVHKRS